jgi:hypothetical protein
MPLSSSCLLLLDKFISASRLHYHNVDVSLERLITTKLTSKLNVREEIMLLKYKMFFALSLKCLILKITHINRTNSYN